ncbi:MAG: Bax inhibitor-1/YccA family protein [Parachlamydiaceae bacterium]|nr:Bax inhibitor-1/YccA family protein [Parachlamydiaceae bacterium]
MRSSNPVLQDDTFAGNGYRNSFAQTETMTTHGVVFKTLLLIVFALLTAGWTWSKFYQSGGNPNSVSALVMIGAIGGLILAVTTAFKPTWAPVTAVAYALFEGLFIGGMSAIMEAQFSGIVIQAAGLTFGTLTAMLIAYQSGLVRATEGFKMGVMAATGGIALVYIATMALGFFGVQVPFIFGNGLAGIGFSLFVVVIAALNFVIDFDFIEQGQAKGAPKYMEWYGAFALMVTLVWLYIECLRLLSKIRSR